jgi:hypothetical protein
MPGLVVHSMPVSIIAKDPLSLLLIFTDTSELLQFRANQIGPFCQEPFASSTLGMSDQNFF